MSDTNKLTSLVKGHMEKMGVTVQALSEKTGLSPQTIMRARGRMISRNTLGTLAIIAGALGVKTKDLYEEG